MNGDTKKGESKMENIMTILVAALWGTLFETPRFDFSGKRPKNRGEYIKEIKLANNSFFVGFESAAKLIETKDINPETENEMNTFFFFAATSYSAEGIAQNCNCPVYHVYRQEGDDMPIDYWVMARRF